MPYLSCSLLTARQCRRWQQAAKLNFDASTASQVFSLMDFVENASKNGTMAVRQFSQPRLEQLAWFRWQYEGSMQDALMKDRKEKKRRLLLRRNLPGQGSSRVSTSSFPATSHLARQLYAFVLNTALRYACILNMHSIESNYVQLAFDLFPTRYCYTSDKYSTSFRNSSRAKFLFYYNARRLKALSSLVLFSSFSI